MTKERVIRSAVYQDSGKPHANLQWYTLRELEADSTGNLYYLLSSQSLTNIGTAMPGQLTCPLRRADDMKTGLTYLEEYIDEIKQKPGFEEISFEKICKMTIDKYQDIFREMLLQPNRYTGCVPGADPFCRAVNVTNEKPLRALTPGKVLPRRFR